jgi:hypothetical protein
MAKALKGIGQRMGEAVQPITVLDDALALDFVQHLSDLLRRVFLMIQKRDEVGNRPLKVNVVFPKRIVSVDEQMLARGG